MKNKIKNEKDLQQALDCGYPMPDEEEMQTRKKRTLSPHALCAKAIREELKKNFPQIKFQIKSDIFAGGNSVSISYTDGLPRNKIEAIAKKYQYGHFDGMNDIYEYSNSRDDIPQVKYVTVSRGMSKKIKEKIVSEIKAKFPDYDSEKWMDSHQCWGSELIYREFYNREF